MKRKCYRVPCIEKWENGKLVRITPVLLPKHSDYENGQFYEHYHVDTRYTAMEAVGMANMLEVRLKSGKTYSAEPRPVATSEPVTWVLHRFREKMDLPTNVDAVCKAKLKDFCIRKGKCPHRGFDLREVEPVNGVISCPLHGLSFHADTGEMVEEHKELFSSR